MPSRAAPATSTATSPPCTPSNRPTASPGRGRRTCWRGEAPTVSFTDEDVRTAMIALVTVRDPLGTSVYDDGGHGSAFDRIGAFQTGFIGGASDCKDLIDHPLPLLPNQFKGTEDSVTRATRPSPTSSPRAGRPQHVLAGATRRTRPRARCPTITARSVSDPTSDNCGEEPALKKDVAIYCAASHEVLVDTVQAAHAVRRLRRFRRRVRGRAGVGRGGPGGARGARSPARPARSSTTASSAAG